VVNDVEQGNGGPAFDALLKSAALEANKVANGNAPAALGPVRRGFFSNKFAELRGGNAGGLPIDNTHTHEEFSKKTRTEFGACSFACQRNCYGGLWSVFFQTIVCVLLVVGAFWLAAFALQPLELTGVTNTPPGVMYVAY